MNQTTLRPVAAAAIAALALVALVTPAHAQVKAALTRDVDRPSAQPVNGTCTTASDTVGAIKCALYSVPAGKRLVVETVSYKMATASGSAVYFVTYGQDAGFASLPFGYPNILSVTPAFAYEQAGARIYTGAQALQMYIDENQSFAAGGSRGGTANYVQSFSFSGYLVDK